MFDKICKVYEYLFSNVSGYKLYKFNPTKLQINQINNFISKLKFEVGGDWIFNYLVFQFNRYYDKKTKFGRGVVQLNWVIGDKALNKWRIRSDEEMYYVEQFRQKYKLVNPLIKGSLILIPEYFDQIRDRGNLIECLDYNLFNNKNKICMFCKFKKDCYELSKVSYL